MCRLENRAEPIDHLLNQNCKSYPHDIHRYHISIYNKSMHDVILMVEHCNCNEWLTTSIASAVSGPCPCPPNSWISPSAICTAAPASSPSFPDHYHHHHHQQQHHFIMIFDQIAPPFHNAGTSKVTQSEVGLIVGACLRTLPQNQLHRHRQEHQGTSRTRSDPWTPKSPSLCSSTLPRRRWRLTCTWSKRTRTPTCCSEAASWWPSPGSAGCTTSSALRPSSRPTWCDKNHQHHHVQPPKII